MSFGRRTLTELTMSVWHTYVLQSVTSHKGCAHVEGKCGCLKKVRVVQLSGEILVAWHEESWRTTRKQIQATELRNISLAKVSFPSSL